MSQSYGVQGRIAAGVQVIILPLLEGVSYLRVIAVFRVFFFLLATI